MQRNDQKDSKACRGSALLNLSLVLALFSCLASGYLFVQWKTLSAEKREYEAVRVQLEDQITSLKGNLKAIQKNSKELQTQSDKDKADKSKALEDLAKAAEVSKKLETELANVTNELDALKKLTEQLKQREGLMPKAAGETSAVLPQGDSGGASSSLTPPPAVLPGSQREPMNIRTINRTFNFVVFDLPEKAVFKTGDAAVVERGGRWIADLKIKQVYSAFVSAEIRKENEKDLIQIGDKVKRS